MTRNASEPGAGIDLEEQRRLAALQRYRVLDTPPEEGFDQITTLAAEVFGVPVALVNLVAEERQFSKSCYGIDLRNLDREVSFCAHTIRTEEVMVIPDAAADPRFADNPFVVDGSIGFYAGAPLTTPDGENIGALCIIDSAPRESFGLRDRMLLTLMARIVMDEFELRFANQRAHEELQRRIEVERDHAKLVAELERKANYDDLTDLANRSLMRDRLKMALAESRRTSASTVVILMDLDNFKQVNDTFGHSAGDRLLQSIAARLSASLRDVDTIARLGGDEFVVIATTTSLVQAERIATRIQDVLTGDPTPEAASTDVSFSIGISVFPRDAHTPEELLRMADIALYAAKHAGKSTYRFYAPDMEEGLTKPATPRPAAD